MAATRLSDSQKQELVARFRGGEASGALAEAFGCSANTVSRVVRTALDPEEYEALKQQRARSTPPTGGSSLQLPLCEAESGATEALATSPSAETATGARLSGPEQDLGATSSELTAEAAKAEPGLSEDQPQFGTWVRQQLDGVGQANAPGLGAPDPGDDPQDPLDGEQGHAALALEDADDFAE